MIVKVDHVHIPAMSTIGVAHGTNANGEQVSFVGDHRPMRALGAALEQTQEPIEVDAADDQILRVGEQWKRP